MKVERYYYSVENKNSDTFSKKLLRFFCLYIGGLFYSIIFYPVLLLRGLLSNICTRKKDYEYEVVLCAIFKNEGKYLQEWIEYHRLIGIDHIFLYNNNSSDCFDEVLQKYIEEGFVTLTDWPCEYGQMSAYKDCYVKFKNSTRWIGYIDIDEFVNLQKYDNIKDMLKHYRFFPTLYLCWRMFGTSGYVNEPDSYSVIERYTSCWQNLCNTGKSFINTSFKNFNFRSPHYYASHIHIFQKISIPLFGVSDNFAFSYGNDIFFSWFYRFHHPRAYINHYWSKSYEWYEYKDYQRGDATGSKMLINRKSQGRFELHELKNISKDYSIQRFLICLRNQISRQNRGTNKCN